MRGILAFSRGSRDIPPRIVSSRPRVLSAGCSSLPDPARPGSQFAPYGVRVDFDEAGIIDATCSCPYDWDGLCKHIVAALLAYSPALV